MILRIILKNFLSFDDEVQFDMFPNLRRTQLSNHIYTNRGVVPVLKQAAKNAVFNTPEIPEEYRTSSAGVTNSQ